MVMRRKNLMLDSLYCIYPLSDSKLQRYYYEELSYRDLAKYLNRHKQDEEKIGKILNSVINVGNFDRAGFKALCRMAKDGELEEFCNFINEVVNG
jgi:hypothetical protein